MVRVIRERMLAAQNKQRSYANPKRRDHVFKVGDRVFLKVSPMKGVMRFRKKGKLAPCYCNTRDFRESGISFRWTFKNTRLAFVASISHRLTYEGPNWVIQKPMVS